MGQIDDSPEHKFLTVRELASLLRIKERKVYDLAASGGVPCTRVTGKILFPTAEIRAWIDSASSGADKAPAQCPQVFLGSHDPLLEWALRQSRCGLATYLDGSLDGLDRFVAGEGVATGLHVAGPQNGVWNIPEVQRRGVEGAVLLSWSVRQRGLVFRDDGPRPIAEITDIRGRRIVPRQAESGTQVLFERLLADAGMSPSDMTLIAAARSENDAVSAVAQGRADVAFGLEELALLHRLLFVPLIEERFDLLIDRRAWFEPPMQRFAEFCRKPEFAAHAMDMAGYDVSDLFKVRWNG